MVAFEQFFHALDNVDSASLSLWERQCQHQAFQWNEALKRSLDLASAFEVEVDLSGRQILIWRLLKAPRSMKSLEDVNILPKSELVSFVHACVKAEALELITIASACAIVPLEVKSLKPKAIRDLKARRQNAEHLKLTKANVRHRLRVMYQACKTKNYYEVLRMSSKASQEELETTLLKYLKAFHPDHLGPYVPEKDEKVTKACLNITTHLNKIRSILCNPDARLQYNTNLSKVRAGESSPQQLKHITTQIPIEDPILLKAHAESALERKDIKKAIKYSRKASVLSGRALMYEIFRIQVEMHDPDEDKSERFRKTIQQLRTLLGSSPKSEVALALAQVHRDHGNDNDALRFGTLALQLEGDTSEAEAFIESLSMKQSDPN